MNDYRVMDRVDPRTNQFRLTVGVDDSNWSLEDVLGDGFTFGTAHPRWAHYVSEVPEVADGDKLFWLDVYEHDQIKFSLAGEGPQCQWDTSGRGAFIILHKEVRHWNMEAGHKHAKALAEMITDWANGDIYWYRLENLLGEVVEECGGVLGGELNMHIFEITEGLNVVDVGGDASYLIIP